MILSLERARDRIAEAIRRAHPTHLAIVGLGGLLLLAITISAEAFIPIVFLAFVLGLVAFWANEFLTLMRAPDSAFPGRFDKLIWGLALVILPPIGAPIFWAFRHGHGEPADDRARKPHPRPWLHDEV